MESSSSLTELVRRLRAGDDTLAGEMFQRYARRLIGLARSHLDSHIRQKVDPEDIVQSVYKSFFRRLEEKQIEVLTWDNLWYLLTVMTLRKCATQAEYLHAARRDARREVPIAAGSSADDSWKQIVDREPGPEEAALLTETLEQTLREFDPEDRDVIVLSLQGLSVREISSQLKRADRSVRRLRERARKWLEGMLTADEKT